MASAYIIEAEGFTKGNDGSVIPKIVTTQKVTYTVSAPSQAFNGRTKFIGLDADAMAHVKINYGGEATNATASDFRIQANARREWFEVPPGKGGKVEFYDGSS